MSGRDGIIISVIIIIIFFAILEKLKMNRILLSSCAKNNMSYVKFQEPVPKCIYINYYFINYSLLLCKRARVIRSKNRSGQSEMVSTWVKIVSNGDTFIDPCSIDLLQWSKTWLVSFMLVCTVIYQLIIILANWPVTNYDS